MNRYLSLICLIAFIGSCTNPKKKGMDSVTTQSSEIIITDSLSIDLVGLKNKGLLKNTEIILVENDPIYHKNKRFNAILLKDILKKYSSVEKLNSSDTKVVFECEDGYKPEMPLDKLWNSKAFLAVSDADAPQGREWEQIIKDGHEMKAEPFYVFYRDVKNDDNSYKRPYNLVKIHFAPFHENDAVLVPKKAMKGYELFKNRCLTCHAINKIGGKMGPELNYPKSVTQYWKREDLKAFIQNPASYRNDVKMPNLGIRADEAEEIVKYLEEMSAEF